MRSSYTTAMLGEEEEEAGTTAKPGTSDLNLRQYRQANEQPVCWRSFTRELVADDAVHLLEVTQGRVGHAVHVELPRTITCATGSREGRALQINAPDSSGGVELSLSAAPHQGFSCGV